MLMFSVHYVVLRGFYATEDTRTPFFIQCVIASVNIVLAITLTMAVDPEDVAPALALAYGASYFVGALLSLTVLSHRLGGLDKRRLLGFVGRVAAAAVPAALIAALALAGLESAGLDVGDKADSLVLLAVGGLIGVLGYVLLARLLRVDEINQVLSVVSGRTRSRPSATT